MWTCPLDSPPEARSAGRGALVIMPGPYASSSGRVKPRGRGTRRRTLRPVPRLLVGPSRISWHSSPPRCGRARARRAATRALAAASPDRGRRCRRARADPGRLAPRGLSSSGCCHSSRSGRRRIARPRQITAGLENTGTDREPPGDAIGGGPDLVLPRRIAEPPASAPRVCGRGRASAGLGPRLPAIVGACRSARGFARGRARAGPTNRRGFGAGPTNQWA